MSGIVYREGLGRPLTWQELDSNFQTVERISQSTADEIRRDVADDVNAAQAAATSASVSASQAAASAGTVGPTVNELARRSYAEAGYNLRPYPESFELGGTLTNSNDVLLHNVSGKAYSGPAGAVAAGTDPASGGFVDRSPATESAVYGTVSELAAGKFPVGKHVILIDRARAVFMVVSGGTVDGYSVLSAGTGQTAVLQHNGCVYLKWLGGVPRTDSKLVLQAAANYSYINRVPIVLEDIYYSTDSLLCGSGTGSPFVAFQGPTIPTQHIEQLGGIHFTGCDGFRIVERTALGLTNLQIFGDGTTTIPSQYGDYLKSLTYSAIRSNEATMDRNCIAYVKNCRFRQWRYALDSSRGAWSSHYENNNITYCYQAGKHFRPHSSRFIHNTIGYCVRGFEMIEQTAGEFHNNELNAGKYTEYLIKFNKSGTSSCCNNYIEHWETPDSVDPAANYGLGFIPIVIEHDRYQAMSDVKVDNNLINTPGAYCAILITPDAAQKNINNISQMFKPRGNDIIGTTFANIVVATTGSGNFIMDNMSGSTANYQLKTAQLDGATGKVWFCGQGAITVYEREYLSRTDIVAAVNNPLFTSADITRDTSFEGGSGGITHTADSRNRVKIRLFVEAKTDATAATFKVTMSKFNQKDRTYEYSIPANSSVPITIDFVQTDPWAAVSEYYFRLQTTTTQPTYLRIHATKEFIPNY